MRYQYIFYSKDCTRVHKRNSYTLRLERKTENGEEIVQVDYYLMDANEHVFAVCNTYSVSAFINGRTNHLQNINLKSELKLIPAELLLEPVVYIYRGNKTPCIAGIPNIKEKD